MAKEIKVKKKKLYFQNNTKWFLKHHFTEPRFKNWIRLPYMYYKHMKAMKGMDLGEKIGD